MKRIFLSFLCIAALLLSLAGCGANGAGGSAADIAADDTDEYDAENAITLVFSDNGVSGGTGDGVETDGTAVTISASGTYVLSGSCADGSLKIKKGTQGVTLVLSGLSLTSSDTAPITCGKSTEVTLLTLSGTVNELADSPENNDETSPENENAENAVIKCKDGSVVTLCGGGTLNITALGKNGIKSGATTDEDGEASLTIRDLTLDITASVNDAINAEQLLNVESGVITITVADDAIHCDYVMNVGTDGTDGPSITVSDCYEGLEAAELNILSGNIAIHASDDCLNSANGDLSGYAFTLTVSGGTLVMDTTSGDGIDSNGDLTISGGTVIVWTANTADNQPLDADGTIRITGGTVLAAGGSTGMGMTLEASQPYVTFGSGRMGGGFSGQRPDSQSGERPELPSGEAPDGMTAPPELSDGASGERPELPSGEAPDGTTAPPDLPDGASGERPELPSGESPDISAMTGDADTVSITKGSTITIQAADGSVLYSGEAPCSAGYVFFSSADLTDGMSYTLLSGGTSLAEATATTEAQSESFDGGRRPDAMPAGRSGGSI